jgi:hypothetical protein
MTGNSTITITPEGVFFGVLIGFGIVGLIGLSFWILLRIEAHRSSLRDMRRRIQMLEEKSYSPKDDRSVK